MFWSLVVVMSMLYADTPAGVELRFSSPEFKFESGEALILNCDSFAPPGGRIVLPDGEKIPLPDLNERAQPLPLTDGGIRYVPFSHPGKYMAIVMNLVVLRFADRKTFHVRQFNIAEFNLIDSDLRNRRAEVGIDAHGIFRVTVLDKEGVPLPRKAISFSKTKASETGSIRLVQIDSDKQGEIFMLGRPEDFHISAAGEGDTLTLQIDPL